jgi:hypothetical protein
VGMAGWLGDRNQGSRRGGWRDTCCVFSCRVRQAAATVVCMRYGLMDVHHRRAVISRGALNDNSSSQQDSSQQEEAGGAFQPWPAWTDRLKAVCGQQGLFCWAKFPELSPPDCSHQVLFRGQISGYMAEIYTCGGRGTDDARGLMQLHGSR